MIACDRLVPGASHRQSATCRAALLTVLQAAIHAGASVLHALDVAHALATNASDQPPHHSTTAGQLTRTAPSLPDTLPLPEVIHARAGCPFRLGILEQLC